MSRRQTGTGASHPCDAMRTAMKPLGLALALAISLLPSPASAGNKDLVIVHSERWIDTIKGTLKNVSSDRAEEVIVVVRFFGDAGSPAKPYHRGSARSHDVGQQTVRVMALDPGQETPFELEIAEKHRKATSFKFEPHAIWRKGRGSRSPRR
jgi:hypothetical protein